MNDRQLKELILAAKGKLPFDIYFYNVWIDVRNVSYDI